MAKKKQKKQQQFLSPEQFMKQRARKLELGKCYMTDLNEYGLGHIIVTRNHTGGKVSMAEYLVDIYCLGVKDSFYRLRMDDYEVEDIVRQIDAMECPYNEAHNWIYGAIAFAEEAGIEPDKSFNLTQYMLEEDTDDIPLMEFEYGKEGKHLLVAHNRQEANRYLPLLKQNLGDGNYDFIVEDTPDYYDEEDELDWNDAVERMKNWKDNPMFKKYGPDVEYTYKHPEYPSTLTLHHSWIQDELADPDNALYLKDELTDRILALPHEELREDLENIIMHHIALTCDGIPDDYDDGQYNGTLSIAIMLLAEVGNNSSSLETVLEVLRQSYDFFEYHFSDGAHEILVPTIYKLAHHQLDCLLDFAKEEGLHTYAKCQIFPAVAAIAFHQPKRRNEVIEWFRQVLIYATDHIAETKAFDSEMAGLLMCDLMHIKAIELKKEIKALFDTNLVSLGICGKYSEVIEKMSDIRRPMNINPFVLEIHERFENMRLCFDHMS